jgi:hypothetical protein
MPGRARREAPMSEEVKFIRGNDRINELAQRPDIAEGVARIRVKTAEARRAYARTAAGLSPWSVPVSTCR